ncbi:MAG: OmpH family outer membrane protein [Chitinophagaceae bacterium]|nr:OmpH family outer membrane protein [Chitinophagaceae bacterium]
MKKAVLLLVITVLIIGITSSASAQGKIGYISTEELIGSMPETEVANTQLQEYQGSLQQQGNDYQRELYEKDSIFGADSAKFTAVQKELKRNDLIALYQKYQGWNQTMQQMIQQKSQDLIVPIRTKALDAIKAAAKENGYTYVLESAAVLVGPPGDDILPLVKKKLGVKDSAPAKPAAGGLKRQ